MPGRGRKSVLSSAEKLGAKRRALKRRSVAQIRSGLNARRAQPVSSSTVNRALKGGRDPLSYLPLTHGKDLRPENKQKRVGWAKQQQNAHTGTWVYLDSKYLYIYEDARGYAHRYWQQPKKKVLLKLKPNPTVLHFYGAVGKDFKSSLHFVAPTPAFGTKQRKSKLTYTSSCFIKMMRALHREVVSNGSMGSNFKCIMDRARQHSSKASTTALGRMGVQLVEGFPAQSWDMNIIENVWGVFDTKLLGSRARTPSGWRRAAMQAWDAVEQSTINKLVGSVKQRMGDVAAIAGEWRGKKK